MLQSGLLTIAGDLQKTFDRPEHPSIRIFIGPAGNPVSLSWLGRRQQWSVARVRWELAHALLRRGIPTPRPLLFAEERCGPQRRTFLVTASPRRATRTLGASESLRRDGANPNAASTAIRQAARVLRQLHDHGFLHTRLAESAFLVANRDVPESSEPGSQGFRSSELGGRRSANVVEFRRPAIIQRSKVRDRSSERASDSDLRPPTSDLRPLNDVLLIHVDAVRWVGEVSPQQAVAQLSSLSASISGGRFTPADRLRFLLAYLGPKCRGEWKSIWAETRDATGEPPLSDGLSRRRFLRAALAVAGLAVGCQVPKQSVLARPARHSIRSGRLVVYSDHKLPKHHPLIEDLILLRKQITVALDLPVQKEEVAIYIFSTEKEFRDYLNRAYPGLPNRRAFFMGSRDELAVYTYWGERIQEDLRHEYTHGLLHASLRAVPLWLDEGLAEYFEVAGPRPGTVNTEYAGRLAASVVNGWRPNLAALEKLEEFSRMQHIHYQEAWAWVHYMLHDTTGAKPVLLAYLHELRTQTNPAPLSERLKRELPNAEERFLAHASTLQTPQLLPAGRVTPTAGTASTGPFPAK
jgi:hypothetical protein